MAVDPSAMTEAGAAGAVASDLTPGVSIGKYRLDRVLGSGGMGVVWAAFDPDLERAVAIKVLRSFDEGNRVAGGGDPAGFAGGAGGHPRGIDGVVTLRTRLLREARAMARLKHPNILTVYEVGTDRNRDYIAMELIDGADLDAWLRTRPPRAEILAALFAAGRGLAAAHHAGLIHRDLKPHNILRGRDSSVYVTDFGLARGQIEDGAEVVQQPIEVAATAVAAGSYPRGVDSVLDSPLTQTGVLIGTPAYMAPEQFAGRAPDPRSDQFAFCITAWEALTGSRPFAGSTLDELRAAASGGVPRVPDSLPPRVGTVLARGLAADPAERWPDMHTLLRELEAALAPPRRSHLPLIVAGVLATAAVVTGAVFLMRDRSAVASNDCGPPAEVFGSAWSAERRKAVIARHKLDVEGIAVASALDDLRARWLDSYQATCKLPPSASRHERLGCLLEVRDDTKEMTDELESDDGKLSIGSIIPLTVAMGMCGGSSSPTRESHETREAPEIRMMPPVPSPPLPPSGHPDPWDASGASGRPSHPIPPRPPVPPHGPPSHGTRPSPPSPPSRD